jgi:tetratricopeptide (TPR) repeat protein
MSVEVYLCEKFQYRHERKAFGRFLQEMLDRFRESDDLYLIIGEPEANTASMDLIVLTHRALIVVELKELIFAEGLSKEQISLRGTEKGDWGYSLQGGSKYRLGGASRDRNPYQQIKRQNYHLRDWLVDHSDHLSGGPWSKQKAIRSIYSWVAISPGFDQASSDVDLPWSEIDRWFKLISIDQLAWEVETAVNPEVEFTHDQMIGLATQLGAKKQENLLEFVPNYVPPSPRLSFFSRPPATKHFVDRGVECEKLQNYLADSRVSIICLGGMGGIGKTHLAAWLLHKTISQGNGGLWIECAEREVTGDSILAAIADRMQDKYQAAFIHNPDQKITDKYDIAIEFLDKRPTLLVINDFHQVQDDRCLHDFLTRVVQKAENLKILLVTCVRPTYLDTPELAPGTFVEMFLEGIPPESIPDYLQEENLSDDQVKYIWEHTSGNPYAIGFVARLLRNRSWEDQLDRLPLFDDERARQWADTLIETLEGDVKTLACKIAVVRSYISLGLIERLAYTSKENVFSLIAQLINAYVLQEVGQDQYQMQGYLREALLVNANTKDIKKAHGTAGAYYDRMAQDLDDPFDKSEALLKCLYHYEHAENWQGILAQADTVYQFLTGCGDRDRSLSVARTAVRAAKASGEKYQGAQWMLRQIVRELDLNHNDEAQENINQAFDFIIQIEDKEISEQIRRWKALEAQLWIQQGRLAYNSGDQTNVDKSFKKGLELAEQSEDRVILADSLASVAQITRYRGNNGKAKKFFIDAGNLANKVGDNRLLAKCISHLGLIARDKGDLNEAKRLFAMAHDKAVLANDLNGEEITYGLLGDIAFRMGDHETAERIFRDRLEKARAIGNTLGIRITLGWLAETLTVKGQLDEAEQLLDECAKRVEEARDVIGSAWLLKRRGQLEIARGNTEAGNKLILDGIKKLKQINNVIYLSDFKKALVKMPSSKQMSLWD